ncbi:DUF5682 family protein [Winogradskya consettensis]|uniref:Uncharacterized protein n=1 Tax=Winogradskya consettensis TaxID=113560 RepID=A0A919T0C0_9ACTN|nr:DUF5682 family protein [Actinoplanes consettensis]GIM83086.1 hypothetical protein Aco04nite_84870 [Actinoplanes consettensis]
MAVTFIGVRHHSPACARLVAATIDELRPAYVLIEGPADLNDRIGELLLGHELPIAIFTSYRDEERRLGSWAPMCAYSPEWVALTHGQAAGAELRFIDLPAWHPALEGRSNRYADAELRYADVMERLCRSFDVDNVDVLWDHLFEFAPDDELAERLATYFDLVRGESAAGESDTAREAYMASWVRAATAAAGDRPVVVITGGFHRPALVAANAVPLPSSWPEVPALPEGALGGSFLVPYSFRRLDAFDGYQSGMPSPAYYQELWESGPERAAQHLVESVAGRLRERKQAVSTADLIAARATAEGLATVRGHRHPARTDVLDGLASALVNEALDVPLPWSSRGTLRAGSHPVVVEMVAALSGTRVGRLHPGTPAPPLVHDLDVSLARFGLDGETDLDLDLTQRAERDRSQVLHRVRVLGVPGFHRGSGPSTGLDPVLRERWALRPDPGRLTAVIEAGAYGATLSDACAAVLAERAAAAGRDVDALAAVLFDAALAGITDVSDQALADIDATVAAAADLGALGRMLAVVLTMWRHDRIFGTARTATSGRVIVAAVRRILWLAEGVRGGPAPADLPRIAALAACRDGLRHAGGALGLSVSDALEVAGRVAADSGAPPDLRGAAFGLQWALADLTPSSGTDAAGSGTDAVGSGNGAGGSGNGVGGLGADVRGSGVDALRVVRGAFVPQSAGDWLAGLFALAREEVLHAEGVVGLLDELLSAMSAEDFLVALPGLRQAFEFFPPRERETIAGRLLARRGLGGTGRSLLRGVTEPEVVAAGMRLDEQVEALLLREGLVGGRD